MNNWPIFIETNWFTVIFMMFTSYNTIYLFKEDPEQLRELFKLELSPMQVNELVMGIGWKDEMSRYHFRAAGNVSTIFDPCLIIF